LVAFALVVTVLAGIGVQQSVADPGDVGIPGPSAGNLTFPTAEKPESKLWFNDGFWWASMWSTTANALTVHRMNPINDVWEDVGPTLETRKDWRQDTLSTGSKLYVASHRLTSGVPVSGARADLYRFSYNASTHTYSPDAGFPAQINNYRTETLTIDRDSIGRLWATWTQGDSVWVNTTTCAGSVCNDAQWGTPFDLATIGGIGTAAAVDSDDISAVTAFGGNRIGVLWSSQASQSFRFAIHQDGAGTGSWALETVLQAPNIADDHINFATSGSTVFAAVKTSIDHSGEPQTLLLKRTDGTPGTWANYKTSDGADKMTRPIVLVDETSQQLHYFLAENTGGSIWEKTSPMGSPTFGGGKGDLVIQDASAMDANNPTSTKQSVNSSTGLRVVASDRTSDLYWTHKEDLGGTGTLVAGFQATTPTTGQVPLTVGFQDLSSGNPTSWAWNFGDSQTSSEQNPSHTYNAVGTYTVTLTVSNGSASDGEVKTAFVTVTAPQPLDADFTADHTTGGAPLQVAFTDTSTGSPTGWSWNFGDGSPASAAQSPTHTYSAVGTYSVALTVTKGAENNVETKSNFITVTVENTYTPTADAIVRPDQPTKNYGTDAALRVRAPSPEYRSIVQFNATNETVGAHNAKLRIFSTDGGPTSGNVHLATAAINETTVNWNNQPTFGGAIATGTAVANGAWAEWDVSSVVNGPGVYTFTLESSNTNSVYYSSKEGANPPQLVVSPATGTAAANFEASPTTFVGPTNVVFTDESAGATSWEWNFGDGSPVSTLQNPTHTYAAVSQSTQYDVTLKINGGGGPLTLTRTKYITVQPAAVLTASFSGSPLTGAPGMNVTFTDSSIGSPTTWEWNFGDGSALGTTQNPVHPYLTAGTYTVSLKVGNGTTTNTLVRSAYVTVTGGGGGNPTNVVASGDAQVQTGSPTKNYGTLAEMRVRGASPEYRAYVKFTLAPGTTPSSLKLRLFASDGGPHSGDVYAIPASSWAEAGLTWSNQPALPATKTALGGTVANGAWFEWDVSSAIVSGQTDYSFVVVTTNTNSLTYNTRETATNKPTLVVS
jgi:PKD repeat protein